MSLPVDVIIATTCEHKRADLLMRAIDSVVAQEGATGRPIVVVNGPRFHPPLVERLRQRADIRMIQIVPGGLFHARRVGFEAVTAEFFAILDDDDIFLPGALARRLAALRDGEADWVVSNGILVRPDREVPYIRDVAAVRGDPYGTLLEDVWLCSAGNLFRTAVVHADTFDAVRSMEITYIAIRLLAEGRRAAFLDEPTFKYFYAPDSLSKKEHYNLPAAETLRTMMRLPVPARVRRKLAGKYRRAMHDLCEYHRHRGELRFAWVAHLRSMSGFPELFRYAGYTRRLFGVTTRTLAAAK